MTLRTQIRVPLELGDRFEHRGIFDRKGEPRWCVVLQIDRDCVRWQAGDPGGRGRKGSFPLKDQNWYVRAISRLGEFIPASEL